MPDIITLGELLVDFVSTAEDVSIKDSPGFVKAPGGAPANVAVGVARLGRPAGSSAGSSAGFTAGFTAGFIGKVGDDPFGRFLAEVVGENGVDVSRISYSKEARTSLAFIAVRSDGAKDISFYRNPGADMMLSPDDIDAEYIKSARVLHFGSISLIDPLPREATLKAAKIAKENGLIVSYDPNYRPTLWGDEAQARDRIPTAFEYADVVKISEEEWDIVTGTSDLEEGARRVLDAGPKLVVISRSEKGCAFRTSSHSGEVPAFKVEVVETIGAGDGFAAAVLVELLARREAGTEIEDLSKSDLEEILRFANAVGALTCTKMGAIPALPTRAEVEDFLRRTERSG